MFHFPSYNIYGLFSYWEEHFTSLEAIWWFINMWAFHLGCVRKWSLFWQWSEGRRSISVRQIMSWIPWYSSKDILIHFYTLSFPFDKLAEEPLESLVTGAFLTCSRWMPTMCRKFSDAKSFETMCFDMFSGEMIIMWVAVPQICRALLHVYLSSSKFLLPRAKLYLL